MLFVGLGAVIIAIAAAAIAIVVLIASASVVVPTCATRISVQLAAFDEFVGLGEFVRVVMLIG